MRKIVGCENGAREALSVAELLGFRMNEWMKQTYRQRARFSEWIYYFTISHNFFLLIILHFSRSHSREEKVPRWHHRRRHWCDMTRASFRLVVSTKDLKMNGSTVLVSSYECASCDVAFIAYSSLLMVPIRRHTQWFFPTLAEQPQRQCEL